MESINHTNRGKWSQAGVPHKGWVCVGIEDLGEPNQLCEMCESADVRYVHHMEHSQYQGTLSVGCVCAEHMEGDYVNPRLREKRIRNASRRRTTWAKRQWRTSLKGNSYLNTEGFNISVYRSKDGSRSWGISVSNRTTGQSQFSRRKYQSEEQAKAAALDALLWAKEHL